MLKVIRKVATGEIVAYAEEDSGAVPLLEEGEEELTWDTTAEELAARARESWPGTGPAPRIYSLDSTPRDIRGGGADLVNEMKKQEIRMEAFSEFMAQTGAATIEHRLMEVIGLLYERVRGGPQNAAEQGRRLDEMHGFFDRINTKLSEVDAAGGDIRKIEAIQWKEE